MFEFLRRETIPRLEANKSYFVNDINMNELDMTTIIMLVTLMTLFVASIRLITIYGTF